jgi:hypothetical protein
MTTKAKTKHVLPQWIPVTERLPRFGRPVLVYRPMAEDTGDPAVKMAERVRGYANSSPQDVEHDFDCWCHPSHWMPIPRLPALGLAGRRGSKGGK